MPHIVTDRRDKWKWTIRKGRKIPCKCTVSFDVGKC